MTSEKGKGPFSHAALDRFRANVKTGSVLEGSLKRWLETVDGRDTLLYKALEVLETIVYDNCWCWMTPRFEDELIGCHTEACNNARVFYYDTKTVLAK